MCWSYYSITINLHQSFSNRKHFIQTHTQTLPHSLFCICVGVKISQFGNVAGNRSRPKKQWTEICLGWFGLINFFNPMLKLKWTVEIEMDDWDLLFLFGFTMDDFEWWVPIGMVLGYFGSVQRNFHVTKTELKIDRFGPNQSRPNPLLLRSKTESFRRFFRSFGISFTPSLVKCLWF